MVGVNYIAIVPAAAASMAVGFVWYGVLFKKQWMVIMGFTPESMKAISMSQNMAYVLSHALVFAQSYLTLWP